MKENNFKQGWWIRKAGYVLAAVIGLVLTGFGVATQDQVDVATASPLLGTLIGSVAAFFTHRGSGDPTTREDVELAESAGHGGPSQVDVQAFIEALNQVQSTGRHALNEAQEAVGDFIYGRS